MLFYVVGSLLFLFGLMFALSVIAANVAQYRAQMVTALRTLSLDSVHAHKRAGSGLALKPGRNRPVLPTAA